MEGLARVAGGLYREITVGGRVWRLAAPRLADMAALEAEILSRLPDPIEQAAKHASLVPAEQLAKYWEAAFVAAAQQRRFQLKNIDQLPEPLGLAAAAYLALRRYHADDIRSLDEAMNWLEQALTEHGQDAIATANAAINEAFGGLPSERPMTANP